MRWSWEDVCKAKVLETGSKGGRSSVFLLWPKAEDRTDKEEQREDINLHANPKSVWCVGSEDFWENEAWDRKQGGGGVEGGRGRDTTIKIKSDVTNRRTPTNTTRLGGFLLPRSKEA